MKKMSFILLVGGSLAFGGVSDFGDFSDFFSGDSNIITTKNGNNFTVGNREGNFTYDKTSNNLPKFNKINNKLTIKLNVQKENMHFENNNKIMYGNGFSFKINKRMKIFNFQVEPFGFCVQTPFGIISINNVDCSTQNNTTTSNEHGHFDAWNDDHNIGDRNITTKIANKEFNLTIASINEDDDAEERKTNPPIDIEVALYDKDSEKNITDYQTFNAFLYKEKNLTFKVSEAERNVTTQFKVCSKYNGSEASHKYDLYPYDDTECHNPDGSDKKCSYPTNETDPSKCIRNFYSTDNFAIRPDHFKVKVDDSKLYKADVNISTISIEAVDEDDNDVKDYNESSDELNLTAIDSNSSAYVPDVNYSFSFEDGNATKIDYVKYPEVGEIDLNISEINGSEFAKVDEDDTPDNERFIEYNISNKFRVIPDHFAIKDINVTNFKGGDFTYLSSKALEKMSAEFNATIVAENESNKTTKNYSGGLYEKDVNFTIPFDVNISKVINLTKIKTQYGENNISDKNISFKITDGNFTNGEFNLSLKINFDRNASKPVNDFNLTLNDINVTDEDNATNNESDDVKNDMNKTKLNFRYGKADAEDVSTYNDDVTVPVHFYYYQNDEWKINNDHNDKSQGDVNSTYTSDKIEVTNLNEDDISQGNQNIDVDASKVPSTPYKATLHLGIAPWLWYSKSGNDYVAPDENHTDCATHPCSNIIINSIPSSAGGENGWRGVSSTDNRNDVNKNTVEVNRSQNDTNNNKKEIYHRLNW